MNDTLTKLGVPLDIQALFNVQQPFFDYGDAVEIIALNYHFVPASHNIWVAGNGAAVEVLIARSAMDCIAFLALSTLKYRQLEKLCFLALGNRPSTAQLNWIRENYGKRKFTLLFEADLMGRATDIFVAVGLKAKRVKLEWTGQQVKVIYNGHSVLFDGEQLTLNAFEQAFSTRTAVRTRKPLQQANYFNQLKYDSTR
ncbi:hypothetical protein SNE26_24175 [Mucilaginibacter sp. cycad4]|uniref:hypothetical protein n=1 Tax=Mucilaginibacter sp. cycad4 TaxID=3342096 RepID=UPI002AAB3139|nr:hypothetical protein [Mucilaginibacter gossypii]WPU99114.1 hypothetical protein SNE26_24175 [Mucilaginibacter gossypii]